MEIGDKLPNFNLPDHDEQMWSPQEFLDKYALLVLFISSESKFSVSYFDRICTLIERYEEDDLAIMVVDVSPEEEYEDFMQCLGQHDLSYQEHTAMEYLLDPEMKVASEFGVEVTPTAFLFNQNRELVYRGPLDDAGENDTIITRVYLQDALENTLDGLEVDFPDVEPYGASVEQQKARRA